MCVTCVDYRVNQHVSGLLILVYADGVSTQQAVIPHARVVGGGSTTNGMVYVRGNRRDYDHWAALGNPGWDYENALYYFKMSEDYRGHTNNYTGDLRFPLK